MEASNDGDPPHFRAERRLCRLGEASGFEDGVRWPRQPAARRYLLDCKHYHGPTQCSVLFTRDTGHHTSGWWKNPDYERCYHLSMSFVGFEGGRAHYLPFDIRMAEKWAKAFYGDEVKNLWIEPPYTEIGKNRGVYHYRLFCDEAWQPIKPRGEVYSKDWTPADWKSFSDIHGDQS